MRGTDLLDNKSHEIIQDSLSETINEWQGMIDLLNYPVFIVDPSFNIVKTNKAFSYLFGELDQLTGPKCYQMFHNAEKPIDDCPMTDALKSGISSQTEIFLPSTGKSLFINTSPIVHSNEIIGVIHSIMDITEVKKNEDDMSDLIDIYASSINDMKSREIRAHKGRDAFLNMLEDINDSYKELEELFLKLIVVMVNALDAKSPWTKGHSERVSMYAELIAEELMLDADDIKNVRLAGLLHDIGKIGTGDDLLNKPGALTKEEFEIIKKHPAQGAEILKHIKQFHDVIPFIHFHHEKLDGNGYPNNLEGELIPLGARILHVADSFDSMTSDRPYRPAPGLEYALAELDKFKGSQFDSEVVDAFLKVLPNSKQWGLNLSSE